MFIFLFLATSITLSQTVILFRFNRKKMSLQQRKARVAQKKAYFLKQQGEGDDDDDDEGSDEE